VVVRRSISLLRQHRGTFNLWRIGIDEATGIADREPEPAVAAGISGDYSFSTSGDIAFSTATHAHLLLAMPSTQTPPKRRKHERFSADRRDPSVAPSPDGRTIAFALGGGQEDLFLANADGTQVRQLTNDAAKDRSARWSPDGKTLYFYSNRGGEFHIWSIRADGSASLR
jgi:Tol biopolymer transport system component